MEFFMQNNTTFYEKQIITGFKTIILGLVLLIVELLSVPIFGVLQKLQVNGQGFQDNFMEYVSWFPYPIIFFITALIILFGAIFLITGYKSKSK